MLRTQILLTEEQHRFLKELGRQTGQSISSMVRHAVDELRRRTKTPSQRALDLLGAFEADRDDVSEHHDDYFSGEETSA